MKRAKEHRSDEKLGGKRSTNDSEVQITIQEELEEVNQEEHSPMSPVPPPVRSASSPVSPVLSHGDQVQATLSSSSPSKESRYLHYTSMYVTTVSICICELEEN